MLVCPVFIFVITMEISLRQLKANVGHIQHACQKRLHLCLPAIRIDGRQVIEQDPANDDCRADQRPLAEQLAIEDRDQHWIEDGLQRVDDGGRDRIRVLGSRREEDVGQAHLDCAEQEDGEEDRRGEVGLLQHKR